MELREELPERKYFPCLDEIDKTFTRIGEVYPYDGVTWNIYYRRRVRTPGVEVRVMPLKGESVEHKANYIMTWDGKQLIGRDADLLSTHREGIYHWVISAMPAGLEKLPPRAKEYEATVGKHEWVTICSLGENDGAEWVLAEHNVLYRLGYRVKLVLYAKGKAPHKALYHLAFNRLDKEFYTTKDLTLLKKYRPILYEAALLKLTSLKFTKKGTAK
jgi:hypothetical protein